MSRRPYLTGVSGIQPGFLLASASAGFRGFVLPWYQMREVGGEHMCTCMHTQPHIHARTYGYTHMCHTFTHVCIHLIHVWAYTFTHTHTPFSTNPLLLFTSLAVTGNLARLRRIWALWSLPGRVYPVEALLWAQEHSVCTGFEGEGWLSLPSAQFLI